MGGDLKDGYCVIGGVVKLEVREFFDGLVSKDSFESRSQAVGHVLTEYMKKHQANDKVGDKDA